MKLKISVNAEKEPSKSSTAASQFILNNDNFVSIAEFLNSTLSKTVNEANVEDLIHWLPVLEKLDNMLSITFDSFLLVTGKAIGTESNNENKHILVSVLRFLSLLLKCAKEKRYYISFKQVSRLIKSSDLDIAVLAIDLLFHVCLPTASIASSLNDDWIDSIEVPDSVAKDCFTLFDSLGLMTPEMSIVDYLRGHESVNININSGCLPIRFPARDGGSVMPVEVEISIPSGAMELEEGHDLLAALKAKHELTDDEVWTVLNLQRALCGYQTDASYRSQLVLLRLQCLFIIVHSRYLPPSLQDYVRPSSHNSFVHDLVELADLSSAETGSAAKSLRLSYVALECVLGLLECKLRRRSTLVLHSSIMTQLGLTRGGLGAVSVAASGARDETWSSVVISACSASSQLFGSSHEKTATSAVASASSGDDVDSVGRFVRMGLELFALSLTTREPHQVVQDLSIVSTIVGVLQAAVPHIQNILLTRKQLQLSGESEISPPSAIEAQTLLVASKALYCLELTLERQGYSTAFRESDGIAAVVGIIKIFSGTESLGEVVNVEGGESSVSSTERQQQLSFASLLDGPMREVLEGALSVLHSSIFKGLQQQTVSQLGTTGSDTGAREPYQSYFAALCVNVFSSPLQHNEHLWMETLNILREVIDADPPFLAHFLASPGAECLIVTLSEFLPTSATPVSIAVKARQIVPVEVDILFVPLVKLAAAVNITNEGKAFLTRARIVDFLIDSAVSPSVLLPKSPSGVSGDKLPKMGKYLAAIMADYEAIRRPTRERLREKLTSLSAEAARIWNNLSMDEDPRLDSPRLQVIQKLANVCVVVENMFTDNRRQITELLKDVLPADVLEGLTVAYQCTLPPSRQMLAQISIRNSSTFPYFGHVPSAKAITSLLRLAASTIPQTILPILFRNLDLQMSQLGASKQALEALKVTGRGAETANVYVLGVLDAFPQKTLIHPDVQALLSTAGDSAMKDDADDEPGFETHTWHYLASTLTVGWLTSMLSNALRSIQKPTINSAVTSGKDVLRRLFSLHRSSMLEVCRFGSATWQAKPLAESGSKKGLMESFSDHNSTTDREHIERGPATYHMRITGSGGALIREGVEIEGSRVVLVADIGTEITAFERRMNVANVVRYRTAHGWISEFRRDHSRSPIIELLSIDVPDSAQDDAENSVEAATTQNEMLELLTLREAVSFVMTRSCPAIKQVVIYLARAVLGTEANARINAMEPFSMQMSLSLTKIVKGFFTNPLECLEGVHMKDSWKALLRGVAHKVADSNEESDGGLSSDVASPHKVLKRQQQNNKRLFSATAVSFAKSNDQSPTDTSEVGESSLLDASTLCLYYGSVVKHILTPFVEDKNSNFIVLLLRTACNEGVVDALMDATSFLVSVLKDEIDLLPPFSEDAEREKLVSLSALGRCALHALPIVLGLVRKLVNKDIFNKSLSAPGNANPPSLLVDDKGAYQTHDLLYNLLQKVARRLVPLFHDQAFARFPTDLQMEWLSIMGELVHSLVAPLPVPVEASTSAGAASSQHQVNSRMDRLGGILDAYRTTGGLGRSVRSFSSAPATPATDALEPPFVPNETLVQTLTTSLGLQRVDVLEAMVAFRSNDRTFMETTLGGSRAPVAVVEPVVTGVSIPMAVDGGVEEEEEDDEEEDDLRRALEMSMAETGGGAATEVSNTTFASEGLPNLVADLESISSASTILPPPAPVEAARTDPLSTPAPTTLQQLLDQHRNQYATGSPTVTPSPAGIATNFSSLFGSLGATSSSTWGDLPLPVSLNAQTPMRMQPPLGGRLEPRMTSSVRDLKASSAPAANAASAATLYLEYNRQSTHLKEFSNSVCADVLENTLTMCRLFGATQRWGSQCDMYLIPSLCQFVVRLDQDVSTGEFSYVAIVTRMVSYIQQEMALISASHFDGSSSFHGHLVFLATLVHDMKVRKETEKLLTRVSMVALVQTLCVALDASSSQLSGGTWSKWFSPALILVYELLAVQSSPNDTLLLHDSDRTSEEEAMIVSEEKEETADTHLAEFKDDPADYPSNGRHGDSEAVFPSSEEVYDNACLLPNAVWSRVFSVVMALVRSLGLLGTLPEADTFQALIMVLETLLHRQIFALQFVESGGVKSLLKLRSSGPISDAERVNSTKVWTLISKRCLDTSLELQLEFGQLVRKTFQKQSASLNAGRHLMTKEKLVQLFSAQILRSPDDFFAAVLNNTRLVRVSVKAVSGDEVDTEKGTHEIQFMLEDADKLSTLLKLDSSRAPSEERAVKALKTMLKHVVSSSRLKYGDSDAYHHLVYPASVVLDSLSDALLSSRRVSVLVARLVKADSEGLHLKASENVVDFLVKKHFTKIGILPDALASEGEHPLGPVQNVDLWACTRFLAALGAHRGVCKLFTLDAVLKMLIMNSATPKVLSSADVLPAEQRAQETHRVTILSRLAKLLSIVMHASKSPQKSAAAGVKGNQEELSLEAVRYLVEKDILQVLTDALASIPVHFSGSGRAVSAILELIELISRPKVQALLDKDGHKSAEDNTNSSSGMEEFVDVTNEESSQRIGSQDFLASSLAALGAASSALNDMLNGAVQDEGEGEEEEPEDEVEEEDEEEEEEHEGGDQDEDDEADDENGDESGAGDDEDDQGEDDEDNQMDEDDAGEEGDESDSEHDEDDDGEDQDEAVLAVDMSAVRHSAQQRRMHEDFGDAEDADNADTSFVNVGNYVVVDHGESGPGGLGPRQTLLSADGQEGYLLRDLSLGRGGQLFSTSSANGSVVAGGGGGRMRQEFSMLFSHGAGGGRDEGGDSMTAIMEALQQSGGLQLGDLFPGANINGLGGAGAGIATSAQQPSEQLLPNGIEAALQVSQPVLSHPMLTRTVPNTSLPVGYTAVSAAQAGLPPGSRVYMPGFATTPAGRLPVQYTVTGGPGGLVGLFDAAALTGGGGRGQPFGGMQVFDDGNAGLWGMSGRGVPPGVPIASRRSAEAAATASASSAVARSILSSVQRRLTNRRLLETVEIFEPVVEPVQEEIVIPTEVAAPAPVQEVITGDVSAEVADETARASDIIAEAPAVPEVDLSFIAPSLVEQSEAAVDVPDLDLGSSVWDVTGAGDASVASTIDSLESGQQQAAAGEQELSSASVAMEVEDAPSVEVEAPTTGETTEEIALIEPASVNVLVPPTGVEEGEGAVEMAVEEAQPEAEAQDDDRPLQCPAGFDEEVFYSLPLDMQQEIVDQQAEQTQQQGGETEQQVRELATLAGFDYDTLQALPESIRNEMLDQARQDQRQAAAVANGGSSSSGGGGADLDNASFLASLTPDLRAEVLITADPVFLASLPPEMIAEAQMLRERMASQIQRNELLGQRAARRIPPAAAPGAGDGGDDDYDSEGDEDDPLYDQDDPLNMGMMMAHGGPRSYQRGERDGRRIPVEKPKNGLIRCPLSASSSFQIPNRLFVTLAKIMLCAVKDANPVVESNCTTLQHKIIQNFSTTSLLKDANLRLLVSLVAEDKELSARVLKEVSGGGEGDQAGASLHSLTASSALDAQAMEDCVAINKPVLSRKRKASAISEEHGVDVSALAAQRIISVLSKLSSSNALFVFLLLVDRDASHNVDNNYLRSLACAPLETVEGESSQSSSSATSVSSVTEDSSVVATLPGPPLSPVRSHGKTTFSSAAVPSHSLFELVVGLLNKSFVAGSATELESLSTLIEIITAPLEQLPEGEVVEESSVAVVTTVASAPAVANSPSDSISSSPVVLASQLTDEMRAKDAKAKMVSLPIPRVVLQRESLSALCDVLMNDHCTRKVFVNITSTVSRLAKIPANCVVLLELVYDVIVDMAEQSQNKMDVLVSYLRDIRTRYMDATADNASVLKGSSSAGNAMTESVKLPCSLLPLGESGGRQHERLLRVVQTLQSMASKTNRVLAEVVPAEQLTALWGSLESVFVQLRAYLVDAEEEGGADNIPAQTTLTSILNRLLPAVESFFLVHTVDLLADRPVTTSSAVVKEASKNTSSSSSTATGTALSSGGELIAASAMPGHQYRTSTQYMRSNLSLHSGEHVDEGTALHSVRSLRKQNSFTSTSSMPRGGGTLGARNHQLLSFVQAHKGVLNLIIKAKPALLETSLSALVRITQLRSFLKFENKRKYFFSQLKRSNMNVSRRGVHLQIRRNQVFEDTYHQLRSRSAEEMRGRLQVNFHGEEGVDAGGLSREWYVILSREIFNPNYALFLAAADGATFQPNPLSNVNTNHLDYFKFVGRVIGKAICDGQLMDAHFTRSFYKHLLGMPVDFGDIEATEPDYYKVLRTVLDTPLDDLMMDLTFSAETQKFGRTEVEELIPNGRNVAVTDDNKEDYIRLVAHHRMTSAIRAQIDSFLAGFYDLVPPELICIFSPAELELLICGLPDVNVDELMQNTDYHQYKATDDVIVWFWEELRAFNREERASFLQFVTGTSKVPLGGFANLQGMRGMQRFSIHRAYGDTGLLPTAHTCFNQLDLPAYSTREELRDKLSMAVNEGSEGFGFA